MGDFLSRCKEKVLNPLPRKILWVSILSIAILAAIFYYFPWYELDSRPSGEKKYPPPGEVSSGAAPPDPKIASVEKEAVVDKPESTPPLQPPKPGEQALPTGSSAPAVSSDPSSAAPPQVPSATASKETRAVKAKDSEKPGKGKVISKESAPPKKMASPAKKDFFAIKIMALRDPQKAREFMDSQKKQGFDIHSRTLAIPDQGLWHQIFLGHFGSQGEAQRFLNEKKIRQSYPGSVIMKLTG